MGKKLELEICWDQEIDGTLVYHACASGKGQEQSPFFRMTVEFLPCARRCFSDEGCRRLVEGIAGKKMRRSLRQLEPAPE
jgi:hypothetical protein